MRSVIKNKRGQLDFPIITFIVVIFSLLLIAPIILKIFGDIKTPVSNAFLNMSDKGGTQAAAGFNKVMNTATGMWDKVVIAAFILATLLMLISSFMIDTNPFWIILYIFMAFMLVLFSPNIIGALDGIYNSPIYAAQVNQLSFMNTLRVHFGEFLVGMIMLTGIIIYGKVAFFGKGSRG